MKYEVTFITEVEENVLRSESYTEVNFTNALAWFQELVKSDNCYYCEVWPIYPSGRRLNKSPVLVYNNMEIWESKGYTVESLLN